MFSPDQHSGDLSEAPSEIAAPTRRSVLVLHGLGGGPYELAPIIESLAAAGLRVLTPILPGHEGPGPIMPASSWRDWVATALADYDKLAADGSRVAVVGFSTGGTLALHLATRRPVDRLVLLAPFLAIRYARLIPIRPSAYIGAMARFFPNLRRRPPAARDPQARERVLAAARYRSFNMAAACSALELIEEVKTRIPEIRAPTLILQGRLDTVVDPRSAVWLRDHLGSEQKSLAMMDHSDHLLALDREGERVVALTRQFVLEGSAGADSATGPVCPLAP